MLSSDVPMDRPFPSTATYIAVLSKSQQPLIIVYKLGATASSPAPLARTDRQMLAGSRARIITANVS
jgi:hypothetical protein